MHKTTAFVLVFLVVLIASAHVDAKKKGKRGKNKCKYDKPEKSACDSATNKFTVTRNLLEDVSDEGCDKVKTKQKKCKCNYNWPDMTEIADTKCTGDVKKVDVTLTLVENNNMDNCEQEKTVTRSCKQIKKRIQKKKGWKKNGKRRNVAAAICNLESVTGECRGYFQKWFYNKSSGACEQFVYGGCRGNDNRFDSLEECTDTCVPTAGDEEQEVKKIKNIAAAEKEENMEVQEKDEKKDLCSLPSRSGRCMAYFEKWYFNSETQSCETFVYGGCDGNDNRFDSEKECNEACSGEGGRRNKKNKNKKGGRRQNRRKGRNNASENNDEESDLD